MKNFFKLMFLFALLLCSLSCNDDDQTVVAGLEVNAVNLNGVWQQAEWNGHSLAEDTCCIKFNCKDQTFEMYLKFDSMYARCITGDFSIRIDPYLGALISGVYDYGDREWNNEYVVTELLESGLMVWTAKDDKSDLILSIFIFPSK